MRTNDIELKGEVIESFERVEEIAEIILLGADGGIRRIIIRNFNEHTKRNRKL